MRLCTALGHKCSCVIIDTQLLLDFNCFVSNKSYKNKTDHPISSNNHPRQLQIKQYTASKWGCGVVKTKGNMIHMILTKYEAVHPMAVSENNSSSGMLIILTINRTVCICIYLKGQINQSQSK